MFRAEGLGFSGRIKWKRIWKIKWKPQVPLRGIQGYYPLVMENQMEKNMEHEMETGIIWWFIGIRGS